MIRPERKVFMLDGGAGRILTAIPALKKYARLNPKKEFYIVAQGWADLFLGIKECQDKVFVPDHKGLFNLIVKDSILITPEPYRLWSYYNQKTSLVEAFDEIINETDDHSDLELPSMVLSKAEELSGYNVVAEARNQQGKKKTIVIQPFGRSAKVEKGIVIDEETRSLEHPVYLQLVEKLSTRYNLILFAEKDFFLKEDTFTIKLTTDMRRWAGIINAADYFIGCDSLGQHIARGFNKPGTVILGSTFAKNTSYPDWFNIFEKDAEKTYLPIRITGFDCYLSNFSNDRIMDFDSKEINDLYKSIVHHCEGK